MKRLIFAFALLTGPGLSSCMDERSPYGSDSDKKNNTSATPDTMARDNTGTMQNGGTSPNGSSSNGGGTGNGGQ